MEEERKVIVVAKVGGIEIFVEGKDGNNYYELTLSKPEATKLALDILNTLYKEGEKI